MSPADNGWREEPAVAPRRGRGRPAGEVLSLEQAAAVLAELAPACAANADVRAAWAAWCEYRVNARLPMTALALRLQARDLAALGSTEAWHALQWSTANQYKGLFAKPKGAPRPPLPGQARAVGQATAAFAVVTRPASATDLAALEDYKRQAETLTRAERFDLLRKCSDALPHLSGSLAARIAMLNQNEKRPQRPRMDAEGRRP